MQLISIYDSWFDWTKHNEPDPQTKCFFFVFQLSSFGCRFHYIAIAVSSAAINDRKKLLRKTNTTNSETKRTCTNDELRGKM